MWSLESIAKGEWGEVAALCRDTRCETRDYILLLARSDHKSHKRLATMLRLISENGPTHDPTGFKRLRPNLYEIKSGNHRVFAFFDLSTHRLIILTHGWKKGTGREQTTQIKRAENLRDQFLSDSNGHHS